MIDKKRDSILFGILCVFLVIALLTGGASRPDAQSHIILRPLAVLVGALALFLGAPGLLRENKAPLVFLLALGALMLIQLVPLPPAIWTQLPGRDLFAQLAPAIGIEQPWRPITLSSAGTLNSLVSLFVPLAGILLFASLRPDRDAAVLAILCGLVLSSAILGLAQIIGPPDGPLYLYRITNNGSAVGFFANRNHQAVLLACLFPMLAVLARIPTDNQGFYRFRLWASIGVGVLLIPLLIVTGSRSGVVLGLVGIMAAYLLFRGGVKRSTSSRARKGPSRWAPLIGAFVVATAMIAATLLFSKGTAFYRFFGTTLTGDLRFKLLEPLTEMALAHFPVGSGFGTFERLYKVREPFELLHFAYLNHAHNDLLELAIEAGLPGIILLGAFLLWWLFRTKTAWKSWPNHLLRPALFARVGSVITLMFMLASIVDYPLRTPFIMVVFVLACCWMERLHSAFAPPRGQPSDA